LSTHLAAIGRTGADFDWIGGKQPYDRRARRRPAPTSRVIRARPEELYAAFLDPAVLIDWLPPAGMTGEIHEFDAQVGGGYRMSLFYPPDERAFLGKTSNKEDMGGRRAVRGTGASPQDR